MASLNNNLTILCGLIIAIAFCFCSINGEEVHYQVCPQKPNVTWACDIKAVRIDPCKEASKNKPCNIKRGTNAGISVDFTPKFSSQKMTNSAYWATGLLDIEFLGMNPNACDYATCPIEAGKEVNYNYTLEINKKYPPHKYTVKWLLTSDDGQECCFLINIKLVK